MSKTIKLEDAVYNDLETVRNKGETKSETVAKILIVADAMRRAINAPPLDTLTLEIARAARDHAETKAA